MLMHPPRWGQLMASDTGVWKPGHLPQGQTTSWCNLCPRGPVGLEHGLSPCPILLCVPLPSPPGTLGVRSVAQRPGPTQVAKELCVRSTRWLGRCGQKPIAAEALPGGGGRGQTWGRSEPHPGSQSPPREHMTCLLGRSNGGRGAGRQDGRWGRRERSEPEKPLLSASSAAHAAEGPGRC